MVAGAPPTDADAFLHPGDGTRALPGPLDACPARASGTGQQLAHADACASGGASRLGRSAGGLEDARCLQRLSAAAHRGGGGLGPRRRGRRAARPGGGGAGPLLGREGGPGLGRAAPGPLARRLAGHEPRPTSRRPRQRDDAGLLESPPEGLHLHFILGGRSTTVQGEALTRLERLAAAGHLSLSVLPEAGHWVQVDDPEGTLRAVVEALA